MDILDIYFKKIGEIIDEDCFDPDLVNDDDEDFYEDFEEND